MNYIARDDWIDNPGGPRGRVVHMMRRVGFAYSDRAARAAAGIGLHPTDLRALALILDSGRSGGTLTIGELGSQLRMNQPTVTAIVDRLRQQELIDRVPIPGDRRKVGLSVTDKGRQTGWAAFGSLVETLHACLATASPSELEAAETVLGLALNALDDV